MKWKSENFIVTEKALFTVKIENCTVEYLNYNISEKYILNFTENEFIIEAETYFGFVRALETIYQLITVK